MKKKMLIGVGILVLVCGLWLGYQHQNKEEEPKYVVGKVKRETIARTVDATGMIEPIQQVELGSKISGIIKSVFVKENDPVKKGDVLVKIEAKAAESQLSQTRSVLQNKESLYQRYQHLYEDGAVSYQVLANAQMEYETALAAYNKAEADMNDTVIVSPIDGVVVGEPMKVGETVSQSVANQMIIVRVADLSRMQVELLVDETDIGRVSEGSRVVFTVDAYPEVEFHGQVTDISRKSVTSSGSVVYYTVYIEVNDQADKLYPSMTARATIYGEEHENAIVVPITALRSDEKGQFVYRKVNDNLEKVYIKTGMMTDTKAEVISGIAVDDDIVVSGKTPEDKNGHQFELGRMPGAK